MITATEYAEAQHQYKKAMVEATAHGLYLKLTGSMWHLTYRGGDAYRSEYIHEIRAFMDGLLWTEWQPLIECDTCKQLKTRSAEDNGGVLLCEDCAPL